MSLLFSGYIENFNPVPQFYALQVEKPLFRTMVTESKEKVMEKGKAGDKKGKR